MIFVIPGIILFNHTKTCVSHVFRFALYMYSRKVQLWATHFGAFHPISPTRILSGFKKNNFKMSTNLYKQFTQQH